MRVAVVSTDDDATRWLEGVLASAGLSVVVMSTPDPKSPELGACDLLIADRDASKTIGTAGPDRRILLVPRGHAVELADALGGGFMDLLVVPAPEDEILARVGRALDRFLAPAKSPTDVDAKTEELAEIVSRVAHALRNADEARERSTRELAEGMLSVFLLVIDSYEAREQGTPGHSRRTGAMARELALRLGRDTEEAGWLELAGRLHDIGHVPLGLDLQSDAPLSRELRRELNHHPTIGYDILEPLGEWGLPVDAIATHHERIDGSGYPKGLSGEDVSVDAQILGIVDVFESLTSPRPWRGAETPEGAIEAIRSMQAFREDVVDGLAEIAPTLSVTPGPIPSPPKHDG